MEIVDILRQRAELGAIASNNEVVQGIHLELCRRDPLYWFDNFCWTSDPRKPQSNIPFVLYDFQRWAITDWYGCIERQEDFGIQKSRDMGASWLLVLLFQYCWLFRPGWSFHVGSRKEQLVDTVVEDPSTLFGKFRYNLNRLPVWMRPVGVEDKKLSIRNPDNGNMFTGESANTSFGRGQRARAILFDELAFWDNAEAAWSGCSETTRCRIPTSTPYGDSNTYGQLMTSVKNQYVVWPDAEKWVEKSKALTVCSEPPLGALPAKEAA